MGGRRAVMAVLMGWLCAACDSVPVQEITVDVSGDRPVFDWEGEATNLTVWTLDGSGETCARNGANVGAGDIVWEVWAAEGEKLSRPLRFDQVPMGGYGELREPLIPGDTYLVSIMNEEPTKDGNVGFAGIGCAEFVAP